MAVFVVTTTIDQSGYTESKYFCSARGALKIAGLFETYEKALEKYNELEVKSDTDDEVVDDENVDDEDDMEFDEDDELEFATIELRKYQMNSDDYDVLITKSGFFDPNK